MQKITGNSSNLPTSLDTNAPQAPAKKTPEQVLKDWSALLDKSAVKTFPAVWDVISSVANGKATSYAEGVFNLMIEHEATDLFVEVFTAYNAILKSLAAANGEPFRAKLILALPHDWCPSDPPALQAAFAKITVNELVVEGEIGDDDEDLGIPQAVCDGIATLLSKPGLTQITIAGHLNDESVVEKALVLSHVNELEFPCVPAFDRSPDSKTESYVTLLTGESTRARLKKMLIEHPVVLNLLAQRMKPGAGWPELQSLGAHIGSDPLDVPPLLQVVSKCPKLTTISLAGQNALTEDKLQALWIGQNGLSGLQSLTHFELTGGDAGDQPRFHANGIPLAFTFLASCPALTHFTWDFKQANPSFIDEVLPLETLTRPSKPIEDALKNPGLALRSLVFKGAFLTAGMLYSLFEALEHNTSLEHLDLSGCWLDIEALGALLAMLKKNTTLKSIVLPNSTHFYYLTPKKQGDAVLQFVPKEGAPRGTAVPMDFVPLTDTRTHPDFDAERKKRADSLLLELQSHVFERLRRSAMPQLAMDVAQFMAVGAAHVGAPDSLASSYNDVAKNVTRILEEQGALRGIVHLSEVQKAKSEGLSKDREDVKPFVQLHNQMSALHGLPDAPLDINEVNADGANKEIQASIDANDPMRLRRAFWNGAIDFGGKCRRDVPLGPLRDVFLEGIQFKPVNKVDANGANLQLMADVKSGQPQSVLRSRLNGAIDHGGLVLKTVPETDQEMRAAFEKKIAVETPPTSVTTTTTTSSTTTTTTTAITAPDKGRPSGSPRRDPDQRTQ